MYRLRQLHGYLLRHAFGSALLGGILVAAIVVGVFARTLWDERADALTHAEQQASNLAKIAERDIERNLELYDLSLQAMVDGWSNADIMALPDTTRRAALFDRSITASNISSAVLLDSNGQLLLNLKSTAPAIVDFKDRTYFQEHRDSPSQDLRVGGPFVSRTDGRVRNMSLTRRLSHPDGSFGGVAVLYLNIEYFHALLEGLDIGPHGRTSILGPRGRVIMTVPYAPDLIATDRGGSPVYRAIADKTSGSFVAASAMDTEERLFVYRTLPHTNIKILVGLSTADIYAPWQRRALSLGGTVMAIGLGLIVLAGMLGRELQARLRAENQLLALANTDGLTGLANRRALEAILADEDNRATRATSGLGILFADVDYFKRYNDSAGHPAGDAVLAAVARAIEGAIQRPGDHAGRYGGEEFMVVLAQTDAQGAMNVAGKICRAVEALGITHPDSPAGRVTVSIGVAAMSQGGFANAQGVVDAADAALYAAKAAGRNRVQLFQLAGDPR